MLKALFIFMGWDYVGGEKVQFKVEDEFPVDGGWIEDEKLTLEISCTAREVSNGSHVFVIADEGTKMTKVEGPLEKR